MTAIRSPVITRREALERALGLGIFGLGAPLVAGSGCGPSAPAPVAPCEPSYDDAPLAWGASLHTPVFYGFADYDASVGSPGSLRVYYPSLDGAPRCAPFVQGPGRFPLVMFLHGQCGEDLHFREWSHLPAVLARCGFVVAVPNLSPIGDPSDLGNETYTLVRSTIEWMRSSWSRRAFLASPQVLGIVGHSRGALHGAYLASTIPTTAYVSLAGDSTDWHPIATLPLNTLRVPKLVVWGTADGRSVLPEANWDVLPVPKHRLSFERGLHWDYLAPEQTRCDGGRTGPCAEADELVADLTAVFLSKCMPRFNVRRVISDSLLPPTGALNAEQQRFAGQHLVSLRRTSAPEGCSATLSWTTADGSGSRDLFRPA